MKNIIICFCIFFLISIDKLLAQKIDFGYMAAFFRQVKIGVLTLTLEKKQ